MRGILLDEGWEFALKGGRMTIGDPRPQIAEIVLTVWQGEIPKYPKVGCGADTLQNAPQSPFFATEATRQLQQMKAGATIRYADGQYLVEVKEEN